VQRTNAHCWELHKGSIWDSWKKRGVFSHTQQTWHEAPLLPDNWDQKGFDLQTTEMWDSNKKKIVFMDGCLTGKYADLAEAYGMFSLDSWGSLDQIYLGWRKSILVTPGPLESIINTTNGVKMFWEEMGAGKSVGEALERIDYFGSGGVKMALFGPDGKRDIGDPEGDDVLYLYGKGLTNAYLAS